MKGTERVVAGLVTAGVTHIFGYPGESTLSLYDAVRREPRITHVMARCERCAGYMADGYARASGKVGICDAPGGVGTPWLVPGLHEAYASAIPVVALVTASPDAAVGRWPTTHCDNAALFGSVSKAVLSLRVPARIEETVDRALTLATAGRPGPVVIDIEPLLLEITGRPVGGRASAGSVSCPPQRPRPDRNLLAEVVAELTQAQRPLLVLGGGVHSSRAYDHVARFCAAFAVPTATTFNGKGALREGSAPWLGVIGAKGQPGANAAAAEADLVLWLGSKAGDKSTQYGRLPAGDALVVQVDADPAALGRTFDAEFALCCDLGAFLDDLREAIEAIRPDWRAPAWSAADSSDNDGTRPPSGWGGAAIAGTLRDLLGPDLRLIADASKASSWVGAYDRTPGGARLVWAPRGSGTLGYALPAAIGASYALRHDQPVVAVGGDGGVTMSAHEIDGAAAANQAIAVVVLDDRALGLLEDIGRHTIGDEFRLPGRPGADWPALGRAYGARAAQVTDLDGLAACLREWRVAGGVMLIDALLSRGEVSPDLGMYIEQGGRSW